MIESTVLQTIQQWKKFGEKVVLATGVFDVLHIEHIRFLEKAKQRGTKLLVGVETDNRVKVIKGADRPINNQIVRLEQLNALKSVDLVFLLPDPFSTQNDWENLIQQLNPDVYAISSHSAYQENKQNICKKFGVDLEIVHEHNPDVSTTEIIRVALMGK